MKKILLTIISLGIIGCTNPAMDEKLADLNETLAELKAEILAADIDGMLADLDTIKEEANQALADVNTKNALDAQSLVLIDSIIANLALVQINLDKAATTEQVASLAAQVAEMTRGINILVFIADYDYDGVMNGFDKCPDTPFNEVNGVDALGCSSTQTPISTTTTTTTG